MTRVNVETGCWDWKGEILQTGYGRAYRHHDFSPTEHRAHRIAYELFVEPIPAGLSICHHCDRPCCVNPDHLFAGTPKDNAMDASRKGRLRRQRRLDDGDAREALRVIRAGSYSVRSLAKFLGVSRVAIVTAIQSAAAAEQRDSGR